MIAISLVLIGVSQIHFVLNICAYIPNLHSINYFNVLITVTVFLSVVFHCSFLKHSWLLNTHIPHYYSSRDLFLLSLYRKMLLIMEIN